MWQQEFWSKPANQGVDTIVAPNRQLLQRYVVGVSRRANATWSLSEFARLVAILTESDEARNALIASGRPLDRTGLQRRDNLDESWVTTVEPLFNDTTAQFALNIQGCVIGDTEMDVD